MRRTLPSYPSLCLLLVTCGAVGPVLVAGCQSTTDSSSEERDVAERDARADGEEASADARSDASEALDASVDGRVESVALRYEFGNQIVGSIVTIRSTGAVEHGERTCCPPRTDMIGETNLDTAKLSAFEKWVAAAATGALAVEEGGLSAEGSRSGELVVFTKDGRRVPIHLVERSATPGGKDKVTRNMSPEALSIRDLVAGLAQQDMDP
jgi:hypothetical protein